MDLNETVNELKQLKNNLSLTEDKYEKLGEAIDESLKIIDTYIAILKLCKRCDDMYKHSVSKLYTDEIVNDEDEFNICKYEFAHSVMTVNRLHGMYDAVKEIQDTDYS